jgi:hypothetical protein
LSTTTTQATELEPTNEQLRRLAIEAAKYKGKTAGDTVARHEVAEQAKVEGWVDWKGDLDSEGKAMLRGVGPVVVVPEQGELFGDLWSHDSGDSGTVDNPCRNRTGDPYWSERQTTRASGCSPEPLDDSIEDCYALHEPIALSSEAVARDRYLEDGEPITAFEAVGQYLKRRATDDTCRSDKGWTNGRQGTARGQYKRGMGMERQVLNHFENPTLTMLSLRLSPEPPNRLTLIQGLSDGVDAALYKLRRRLVEDADAPLTSDEWEYMVVFAGTEERATPHAHILVYTEGDVTRDRFEDVVRWYVEKCPYAPDDMSGNSPDGGVISIRGNCDDTIPRVDGESCELRDDIVGTNSQAAVYALTQLPHLADVTDMARDELLHSSTLDAFAGSAFRTSVPSHAIDEQYMPTSDTESDNPCRSRTDHRTRYVGEAGR